MNKRIVLMLLPIMMLVTLAIGPLGNVAAAPLTGAALALAPGDPVPLNPDHVGATNPGFEEDTCPTPPAGQEGWWGWHFIMPDNNNFTSLTVTFQNAGTFSANPFPGSVFVAHPDNSHAYIWTPTPDTLLAGSATSDGDNTFFNLSHVCLGSAPTNTPTNTATDTPTDTPTNTPVPPTDTPTVKPSNTPGGPPTNTPTPKVSNTPTDTPTNTPTDTPTNTPTDTPTNTPTDTPTNTPTATNTPASLGQLKVCKVAGAGVAPGTIFTINVNGTSYNVPAGANDGLCVLAGQFPINTNVTVQEVIPAGYVVARIEVLPNNRAVSKNLALGKAVVTIGTGVTEVIFTNKADDLPTKTPTAVVTPRPTRTPGPATATPAPTGRLQICKEADGSGVTGNFTFTFAGKTRTIPVGTCTSLIVVPAGPLTITEVARPGYTLTDIYTIPADRLISENLAARSATVTIVQGYSASQTIVVFRNQVQTTIR